MQQWTKEKTLSSWVSLVGEIEKPRETDKSPEKPTEIPRGNCMERPRDRRGTEDRSAEVERAVDRKTETEQRDVKV